MYDNKTGRKKKKERKKNCNKFSSGSEIVSVFNLSNVRFCFTIRYSRIYRDSKCLLSSAESPFAGRELLSFYLTSKFRKKRRLTVVATVICFQENTVKGSLLTVSVIATTSRRTTHFSWSFPLRWRQHYDPKLSNSVAVVAVFLVVQLMVLETCWWV